MGRGRPAAAIATEELVSAEAELERAGGRSGRSSGWAGWRRRRGPSSDAARAHEEHEREARQLQGQVDFLNEKLRCAEAVSASALAAPREDASAGARSGRLQR